MLGPKLKELKKDAAFYTLIPKNMATKDLGLKHPRSKISVKTRSELSETSFFAVLEADVRKDPGAQALSNEETKTAEPEAIVDLTGVPSDESSRSEDRVVLRFAVE